MMLMMKKYGIMTLSSGPKKPTKSKKLKKGQNSQKNGDQPREKLQQPQFSGLGRFRGTHSTYSHKNQPTDQINLGSQKNQAVEGSKENIKNRKITKKLKVDGQSPFAETSNNIRLSSENFLSKVMIGGISQITPSARNLTKFMPQTEKFRNQKTTFSRSKRQRSSNVRSMISSELRVSKERGPFIQSVVVKDKRTHPDQSHEFSQNSNSFMIGGYQDLSLDIDGHLQKTQDKIQCSFDDGDSVAREHPPGTDPIIESNLMHKLKDLRTKFKQKEQPSNPQATKSSIISEFNVFKYLSPKFSEKLRLDISGLKNYGQGSPKNKTSSIQHQAPKNCKSRKSKKSTIVQSSANQIESTTEKLASNPSENIRFFLQAPNSRKQNLNQQNSSSSDKNPKSLMFKQLHNLKIVLDARGSLHQNTSPRSIGSMIEMKTQKKSQAGPIIQQAVNSSRKRQSSQNQKKSHEFKSQYLVTNQLKDFGDKNHYNRAQSLKYSQLLSQTILPKQSPNQFQISELKHLTDRINSAKLGSRSLDKIKTQIHRSPSKDTGLSILQEKLKLKGKKKSSKILRYPENSKMKSKNPVSSSEASFTKSFLMSAQILPSLTPKDQKNKLNFGNSILQSTEDFFDRDTPARNIFFKSPKNQSTVVISQQLKNLPKLQFGVDAGGLKIRNVAAKKLEVDRQTDTNPVISSVQKITANTPKGQEHQPTRGNYVSKSLASIRRVPDHHLLSPPMKQIFKVPASKFNKTNKQSKKSHQSSSQNYLESVTKIIKALKLPPNAQFSFFWSNFNLDDCALNQILKQVRDQVVHPRFVYTDNRLDFLSV